MKKQPKTFAQRARDIKAKYTRAEFDPREAAEMEAELEGLMNEQEAFRNAMGMNQQTQQFELGGNPEDPEIQDINNPTQYPNGSIYQDNRGWLERGMDKVYGSYEANKPQLFKDFPIVDTPGMMLQYVTGNTPSNGSVKGGALLLIGGGKGFKNLPVNRSIPKQTFSTAKNVVSSKPNIISGATAAEKLAAREARTMDKLVNAPGGLSKQFPAGTEKTVMDELVNAPGGLSKQFPNGATNLGQKAGKGVVSQAQVSQVQAPYIAPQRPVGYLDNISNDVAGNINMSYPNLGYGVAGAGALGLGIYGLTQLPDGRIVDKQGKPVTQAQLKAIQDSTKTQVPLRNTSTDIPGTPVLPYTPAPTLDANGYPVGSWAARHGKVTSPVQQVKSGVKSGGKGSSKNTFKVEQAVDSPLSLTEAWQTAGRIQGVEDYYDRYGKYKEYGKQAVDEPLSISEAKTIGNLQNKSISGTSDPFYINKPEGNKDSFWNKNKGYLPYAISGATNLAGNLLLANEAKKTPKINASYAIPERINMEPQAEQLRREATVAKNINMKNARDMGVGTGAALANMGALNAGVSRGLGDNLTKLYGQQEQFNTQSANQFALQNQEAVNRAKMFNAQLEQRGNEAKLGFLNDAVGTIPGVMKDVRMDKADKEMRDVQKAYADSLSKHSKNYKSKGDIFSMNGLEFIVEELDEEGNVTKYKPAKETTKTTPKKTGVLGYTPLTFQKQKFNTKIH